MSLRTRTRAYTSLTCQALSPTSSTQDVFQTPRPRSYLPFSFGAEFEIIIQPKSGLIGGKPLPDDESTTRALRDAGLNILHDVAEHLTAGGMIGHAHTDSDESLDYSVWNVVLDGSLSKAHLRDGFYPVEIVTPIILADEHWPSRISKFFQVLSTHFTFRRDTSCGFHVHVSPVTRTYQMAELRLMAKAVCFWEPATSRCAPPSRQDRVNSFCNSNIKGTNLRDVFRQNGPLRGLRAAYDIIDRLNTRDEIVDFVCEDKYRAWNLLPCKTGKTGSIEFRRAPGVVASKSATHWIAFVLSFVDMAVQFSPTAMTNRLQRGTLDRFCHPDFEEQLLASARAIGCHAQLDPRLRQPDNPRSLYISTMPENDLGYLQALDPDYGNPRV